MKTILLTTILLGAIASNHSVHSAPLENSSFSNNKVLSSIQFNNGYTEIIIDATNEVYSPVDLVICDTRDRCIDESLNLIEIGKHQYKLPKDISDKDFRAIELIKISGKSESGDFINLYTDF